jgi:hypothetical protein
LSPLSGAVDASTAPTTVAEIAEITPNALPARVRDTVSDARPRAREFEPLSADRFGVHFTADAELRELIERARALASHRLPNGDLAGLMKLMAASFVRQEEKRRFGIGARPRRAKTKANTNASTNTNTRPVHSAEQPAPPGEVAKLRVPIETTAHEARAAQPGKRRRYVSRMVRREIHGRDHGQCSFVSAEGRRCTARAFLEFDHVMPFARLGAADAPNIRLLCQAHNLLHARACFGAMHIAAKIAASKRPNV